MSILYFSPAASSASAVFTGSGPPMCSDSRLRAKPKPSPGLPPLWKARSRTSNTSRRSFGMSVRPYPTRLLSMPKSTSILSEYFAFSLSISQRRPSSLLPRTPKNMCPGPCSLTATVFSPIETAARTFSSGVPLPWLYKVCVCRSFVSIYCLLNPAGARSCGP